MRFRGRVDDKLFSSDARVGTSLSTFQEAKTRDLFVKSARKFRAHDAFCKEADSTTAATGKSRTSGLHSGANCAGNKTTGVTKASENQRKYHPKRPGEKKR